jgi:biotin transport system substrate-specific component
MTSAPLVDRLWAPSADRRLIRNVVLAFAGVALLTLAAKFKVPFYPVPMTMQTLVVLLIGAAYGWRLGMATVALYLAHGFFGAPVFAGTPPAVAGPAYFLGPTGGFLIAFLFSSAIAGYATERGLHRSVPLLFASLVAAEAVVFTLGFGWLAFFATLANGGVGLGAEKAFALAVQPFVFGDLLKVSIATALVTVFARRTA